MNSCIVFEDNFKVDTLDPDGKKFDKGFRVMLPVRSKTARGQQDHMPSSYFIPQTCPSFYSLRSSLISTSFPRTYDGYRIVHLLGKWESSPYDGGHSVPVGGIVYYITTPSRLADMAVNHFHAPFYLMFMLSVYALLSKTWVEVSGSSAKDVSKQLKEQQMVMPGHREASLQRELNRYIPTAAAFGGMCISALTVLADLKGAIGSGTGILRPVIHHPRYIPSSSYISYNEDNTSDHRTLLSDPSVEGEQR